MATKLMSSSKCTADDVAAKVLKAIDRRRLYVTVPGMATFFWRLKRLMPVGLLKLIAKRDIPGRGQQLGRDTDAV
jgi:hypothetical protein